MEDIWELPSGDKVGRVSETFESIWEKELSNPNGPSLVIYTRTYITDPLLAINNKKVVLGNCRDLGQLKLPFF